MTNKSVVLVKKGTWWLFGTDIWQAVSGSKVIYRARFTKKCSSRAVFTLDYKRVGHWLSADGGEAYHHVDEFDREVTNAYLKPSLFDAKQKKIDKLWAFDKVEHALENMDKL